MFFVIKFYFQNVTVFKNEKLIFKNVNVNSLTNLTYNFQEI
jgi:hypothetical protein